MQPGQLRIGLIRLKNLLTRRSYLPTKRRTSSVRRLHSTSNLRRRLYEILERGSAGDRASLIFDRCIVTLIIVNLTAVALESIPSLAARYGLWFDAIEYGHHEAAVAAHGEHASARIEHGCHHGRGQSGPHGGEGIVEEQRVRDLGPIIARKPDFIHPVVEADDAVLRHHLAHVVN